MMHRDKRKTAEASAVKVLPEPKADRIVPSLEGNVLLFVVEDPSRVDFLDIEGAGVGSGRVDYEGFFAGPERKADLLVFAGIRYLWDETNMKRFTAALGEFRRVNPTSAVIIDGSDSPLFKGLTRLHDEGKINAIVASCTGAGAAIEAGLEVLSILRDV